ncbi:MAG: hypothetical protein A2991_01175 [Candidatus Terrybacteria bacterium RIFCSPLOWO2_01_FULL_58_14]|uniref:O-antigen ligase-related domain-containing protein n=1 Tax=Candidatus Terrybacteria bacterium RIFCSPLOWO2_01_FULL_58_14 TaxID=1802369 RepID=A0A1G2Q0D7_9BACT|nr:MAG: hypothetical protein A2991_01175 [Candidatus Terrybacteria bacterium RIFCSPLOWO2_01_FULL_58_14]
MLLAAVPALLLHGNALSIWAFLKVIEGIALFAYVHARGPALLTSSVPLVGFLAGLTVQAIAAFVQFARQRDLGFSFLDESPIAGNLPGVAKFSVHGADVVRAYGFTPHPNILAALLVAGLMAVAFLYLVRGVRLRFGYRIERQREEIVRGLLVFVFATGLVVTFSRSGWAAAAAGLFFVLAVVTRHARLREQFGWEALRFAILLVAILSLLWWIFSPFLAARASIFPQEEAIALRSFYNREAVAMLVRDPFSGVGPGRFVEALAERNPNLPTWSFQPAHNVFLLVGAEYGIAAAAALLLVSIFLAGRVWRRIFSSQDPKTRLANACLFSFLISLAVLALGDHFLWTTQQGRFLFALALGFAAAGFPQETRIIPVS